MTPVKKLWINHKIVEFMRKSNHRIDGLIEGYHFDSSVVFCAIESKNVFSSDADNPITFSPDGEITCRGNKLKLGRIIRAIVASIDDFKDEDIEDVVSKWKTLYTIDTSIVKTSDDVAKVYGMGAVGGSCMSRVHSSWFKIYTDMQTTMVYIGEKGDLRARALVHQMVDAEGNEYTIMDRVFYSSEQDKLTLQQWRREQDGMERFKNIDCYLRGKYEICDEYDAVPYVDNIYHVIDIDGSHYLATDNEFEGSLSVDTLHEQSGGSSDGVIAGYGEDMVYAYDIEQYIHIDDSYFNQTNDEHYGSSDDLVYIDSHGYYSYDDENIAHDNETDEYDFTENMTWVDSEDFWTSSNEYYYCDDRNEHFHIDEIVFTEDGYTTHIDSATYIQDTEYYVYHVDCYFEHDNGKWYSEPEEEEEVA